MFGLALLANIGYCAAYLVDVPVQCSGFRKSWRRRRWILRLVGTLFAAALTYYWIADEMYPSASPGELPTIAATMAVGAQRP